MILAQGGVDQRWKTDDGEPFLGIPKHLVQVHGEPILERTVRLLRQRGATDIIITGPADDPRYQVEGATTIEQDQSTWTWPGINATHGTRELWSTTGRTTLMFGDVFYTLEAIAAITSCDADDLHWFRRPTSSDVTGHKWDEPFALSFLPEHHDRIVEVGRQVVDGWSGPKKPHLWHHMAAYLGIDAHRVSDLVNAPNQTKIDDWTDDFDSSADWTRWAGRFYRDAVKVAVCFPWRDGDAHRCRSLKYVTAHYARLGVPLFFGTADGDLFNVSAARNASVEAALNAHPDLEVLFIADSDTFVPSEQFWAAAGLARETGELTMAFTNYVRLNDAQSTAVYGGKPVKSSRSIKNHASGAYALPADLWCSMGGQDERFVSWGAEDRAFWLTCNTLAGRPGSLRIPGQAYHLYHSPSPERNKNLPEYQQNFALGMRYKVAAGVRTATGALPETADEIEPDAEALLNILCEPGGPLNRGESLGRAIDRPRPPSDSGLILFRNRHTNAVASVDPENTRILKRVRRSPHWVEMKGDVA